MPFIKLLAIRQRAMNGFAACICFLGMTMILSSSAESNQGGANDLVICTGLLHELEHPDQVLKAIHSLCTPMTHVIFNVPNADSLHRVLGMWSGYIENVHELTERNQELQQHSVYDRGSFAKLLEESGFMVEKTGTFFIKPFTHRQMAACLKYGILNQRILDGLYRLSEDLPDFGSELYAVCRLVDGRG